MARATVLSAMLGVVVFGAVKLAVADPGGPVTPDELTYAGVVLNAAGTAPVTGPVELSFTMRRSDGAACGPVSSRTTASSTGAFTARIGTTGCSRSFFNGATIHYEVSLVAPASEAGPLTPDGGVPITPVPYARFADQAGVNNDCPAGFGLDRSAGPGMVCVRSLQQGSVELRDEVVKVGRGATAFWIDRYEAGIYHVATGAQLNAAASSGGASTEIEMVGLLRNGRPPMRVGETPLAISRAAMPTVNVTWFQANMACRAAGKRLATGDEWLAAAAGTADDAACNVSGTVARAASMTGSCRSVWGAHDMIGNVLEWTAEWYASVGQTTSMAMGGPGGVVTGQRVNSSSQPWPSGYGDDGTANIATTAQRDPVGDVMGIPAAALRGGYFRSGDLAGVFGIDLRNGPSTWSEAVGFRCVVPR